MRLSKEERIILRFIDMEGGFVTSSYPFNASPKVCNLIEKGILNAECIHGQVIARPYVLDAFYYISLSDCGRRLLKNHPELLHRNACAAFLRRSCTFIKEHWRIALCALILIISAIVLMLK